MKKRLKGILIFVPVIYFLVLLSSFFFHNSIDMDYLSKVGLAVGFIVLIGALPLKKVAHYSGRGVMGSHPELPSDDYIQNKMQDKFSKTKQTENKLDAYQDIFTLSGVIIILIAILMI
ncbi:hypothetical protein J0K78_04070 [Halobacillus sp. GSS1]|uniref:hypothetical protein n=1 Tax=Halobacillus sp. GSS1 TaxID=2815919 RepID=UPI001A8DD082|nr:hypothetical protein [Halobacillus sp. GSS1]MBN9653434.1 hypothetical protein [Halobacillus sp. GSS1]